MIWPGEIRLITGWILSREMIAATTHAVRCVAKLARTDVAGSAAASTAGLVGVSPPKLLPVASWTLGSCTGMVLALAGADACATSPTVPPIARHTRERGKIFAQKE